ncbi:MAG: ArsR family transcriptional regulator [Solirubrobacteraceae bacterium]
MALDESAEQSLVDRVAALEERVADLEQRVPVAPTAPPVAAGGVPALDPDTFWALTGLRERIGTGSAVLFTGSVGLPGNRSYVWQQGEDAAALLTDDWDGAAAALAALGHPIRLRLLRRALGGAETTAELSAVEGIGTTGQLYHHLRELTTAGWLTVAARGRYEVPAARVIPLLVVIAAARS